MDKKKQIRLLRNYLSPLFSDRRYIQMMSKLRCGYEFDLDNPKTFNEKLNWLKINNREPRFTIMADKYNAKEYVANIIGREYVLPIIAAWDRSDDIDFNLLPDRCMIKSNYNSGGVVKYIKGKTDESFVRHKLRGRFEFINFYYKSREWPYKNIKKKIFAEPMLDCPDDEVLNDYKFWCFNGEPKIMYVTCKSSSVFENFYDMDFKPLPRDHGFKRHKPEFDKPEAFETMKELAQKLSKDIPFLRVDFFYVNGKVFFAENTFFDWGGFQPFAGNWDDELGKLIVLPYEK